MKLCQSFPNFNLCTASTGNIRKALKLQMPRPNAGLQWHRSLESVFGNSPHAYDARPGLGPADQHSHAYFYMIQCFVPEWARGGGGGGISKGAYS